MPLSLTSGTTFFDLSEWCEDAELVAALGACVEAQRRAVELMGYGFEAAPNALEDVSEEALQRILAAESDVEGPATNDEITNVVPFNLHTIERSVNSAELIAQRKAVDRLVAARVRGSIEGGDALSVTPSGHFWYPPGGYMGWHTNSAAPGWRLYVTHAEEPGRSFFRFRDPTTGEIITSLDREWDARLFEIRRDRPFWHAVHSETNRFSLGYMVHPRRPWRTLWGKLRGVLRSPGTVFRTRVLGAGRPR